MKRRRHRPTDPWTNESIENLVADLRLIAKNSAPGMSRHDLRHISSPLREIAVDDRLLHAWRKLGFEKSPSIPCLRWTGRGVDEATIAIGGGGRDTPQNPKTPSLTGGPLTIIGEDEHGASILLPPSDALSWTIINGASGDLLTSNADDPFLDDVLPITKFFRDCTIYFRGLTISRAEVIQHVAVGRDGVHYGRNGLRDEKKRDALEFLSTGIIHNRDVVFYVYLSIAQAIANAPDIGRFIETAESMLRR